MSKTAEQIQKQVQSLQFTHFNEQTAWEIGQYLYQEAQQNTYPIVIDIRLNQRQLFYAALPGSTTNNQRWVERKINLVNLTGHSSYYWSLLLKEQNKTIEQKLLLPETDYAPHGGCVPILLKKTGMVGTITVSGLPQEQDHQIVINAIQSNLN
jgi:uncharacterized protein (UPF0303 family)